MSGHTARHRGQDPWAKAAAGPALHSTPISPRNAPCPIQNLCNASSLHTHHCQCLPLGGGGLGLAGHWPGADGNRFLPALVIPYGIFTMSALVVR